MTEDQKIDAVLDILGCPPYRVVSQRDGRAVVLPNLYLTAPGVGSVTMDSEAYRIFESEEQADFFVLYKQAEQIVAALTEARKP